MTNKTLRPSRMKAATHEARLKTRKVCESSPCIERVLELANVASVVDLMYVQTSRYPAESKSTSQPKVSDCGGRMKPSATNSTRLNGGLTK